VIVRTSADSPLLVRQTDHALLSGAFAAAWEWEMHHRDSVLIAAARHDDGWAGWELAPRLGDDGRPLTFITTPVEDHVALYKHGIDLVEVEDPYAGWLVSMHGERLYTRPFVSGAPPRIETLTGRDRELADEYVAYETQRQAVLAETSIRFLGGPLVTGDLVAEAEQAWRLIQVWDRLSLLCCMQEPDPSASLEMPTVRGPDGEQVQLEARGTEDGALEVHPYPFGTGERTFHLAALDPGAAKWEDERSFREAYRLARPVAVEVRVRPRA